MAHTFLGSVKLKGSETMLTREEKVQQVLKSLQKFGKDKINTLDAALIMDCDSETVRRHMAKGNIRSVAIGRAYFTSKQWLQDYVVSESFFYINNVIKNQQLLFEENKGRIICFCSLPRTTNDIHAYIGYCDVYYTRIVLKKLVAEEKLIRLPRKNRVTCYQYIATFAENCFT